MHSSWSLSGEWDNSNVLQPPPARPLRVVQYNVWRRRVLHCSLALATTMAAAAGTSGGSSHNDPQKQQTVLVCGAAGWLGRAIVDELIEHGCAVRAFDLDPGQWRCVAMNHRLFLSCVGVAVELTCFLTS